MSTASSSSRRTDRSLVVIEAVVGVGVLAAIIGKTYGAASTIMFLLAALAATFSGVVLIRMFTALRDETLDVPGPVTDAERENLEAEKSILLHGIKEFEADAAQGKVDADDYDHLRKTAEARAVDIIRQLREKDEAYLEKAEALVQKRIGGKAAPSTPAKKAEKAEKVAAKKDLPAPPAPGTRAAGLFIDEPTRFVERSDALVCSACDTENDADARYCIGCGRPRETEDAA